MFELTISLVFLYPYCAIVAGVDKAHFGTYWTPTVLLIVPFTVVVSAHFIFGHRLGFVSLDPTVIHVWIAGTFIFWISGHVVRQVLNRRRGAQHRALSVTQDMSSRSVVVWSIVCGSVALVLLVYAYWILTRLGGVIALASPGFRDEWGFGWAAHVRTILIVVMIMIIGTTKRWTISIVGSLMLMMLVILLYQSKGALLAPIIAGALFRILRGDLSPRPRHFVVAIIGSFLLFQLVYLVGWAALDPSSLFKADVYAFFSLHFMSYLFSGILGFSESLRQGVTWLNAEVAVLFAPLWNLFAVVFDRPLILVAELAQDHYVQIAEHGVGSNVNTLFGTVFLAAGPLLGVGVVVILSIACHALLIASFRYPNRWLLVAYCYWVSLLVFGWFEYYFWLLACIEVPVICLAIAMMEAYLQPKQDRANGATATG